VFSVFLSLAQSPRDLVQEQLDAYNDRDIERFVSVFSNDVELWTLGDSIPSVKGLFSVQKVYGDLFKSNQDLHSEVLNRTIIGNKVIDYEKIEGLKKDGGILYLVMVYEIKEGKIFRATAIRD
jgi:hypothetical protein